MDIPRDPGDRDPDFSDTSTGADSVLGDDLYDENTRYGADPDSIENQTEAGTGINLPDSEPPVEEVSDSQHDELTERYEVDEPVEASSDAPDDDPIEQQDEPPRPGDTGRAAVKESVEYESGDPVQPEKGDTDRDVRPKDSEVISETPEVIEGTAIAETDSVTDTDNKDLAEVSDDKAERPVMAETPEVIEPQTVKPDEQAEVNAEEDHDDTSDNARQVTWQPRDDFEAMVMGEPDEGDTSKAVEKIHEMAGPSVYGVCELAIGAASTSIERHVGNRAVPGVGYRNELSWLSKPAEDIHVMIHDNKRPSSSDVAQARLNGQPEWISSFYPNVLSEPTSFINVNVARTEADNTRTADAPEFRVITNLRYSVANNADPGAAIDFLGVKAIYQKLDGTPYPNSTSALNEIVGITDNTPPEIAFALIDEYLINGAYQVMANSIDVEAMASERREVETTKDTEISINAMEREALKGSLNALVERRTETLLPEGAEPAQDGLDSYREVGQNAAHDAVVEISRFIERTAVLNQEGLNAVSNMIRLAVLDNEPETVQEYIRLLDAMPYRYKGLLAQAYFAASRLGDDAESISSNTTLLNELLENESTEVFARNLSEPNSMFTSDRYLTPADGRPVLRSVIRELAVYDLPLDTEMLDKYTTSTVTKEMARSGVAAEGTFVDGENRWLIRMNYYEQLKETGDAEKAQQGIDGLIHELSGSGGDVLGNRFLLSSIPEALPLTTNPEIVRKLVNRYISTFESGDTTDAALFNNLLGIGHHVLSRPDVLQAHPGLPADIEAAVTRNYEGGEDENSALQREKRFTIMILHSAIMAHNGASPEEILNHIRAEEEDRIAAIREMYPGVDTYQEKNERTLAAGPRNFALAASARLYAQQGSFNKSSVLIDRLTSHVNDTLMLCWPYAKTPDQVMSLRPTDSLKDLIDVEAINKGVEAFETEIDGEIISDADVSSSRPSTTKDARDKFSQGVLFDSAMALTSNDVAVLSERAKIVAGLTTSNNTWSTRPDALSQEDEAHNKQHLLMLVDKVRSLDPVAAHDLVMDMAGVLRPNQTTAPLARQLFSLITAYPGRDGLDMVRKDLAASPLTEAQIADRLSQFAINLKFNAAKLG